MVKFGLMVLITALGVTGGLVYAPFVPAAIYYFFAVLRPQFIWGHSLEMFVPPDFPWSMILAATAIVAAFVSKASMWIAPNRFAGVTVPRLNVAHALMGFFALWITASYLTADFPEVSKPFFADYRKIFIMFFVTLIAVMFDS